MTDQEVDQEKILDEALLIVKSQAYQMKVAIENNKLRNSLKFAKAMLDTLKSTTLSPSNYYQLFLSIFDEMQYIFNYFITSYFFPFLMKCNIYLITLEKKLVVVVV